jgi:serine/threonine protein kinase
MLKDKINKYKLLGSSGMGGFGNIYKAVSGNGDIVALKTLNHHLLDNKKIVDRFFNEAKILSKLNHTNICKLLDFFSDGPDFVIVMEYIDGSDLKELIIHESGNPLPFNRAINIADQCLAALHYAYDMGVLHRDIKPSNIMIDKNWKSIITDFGTAAVIDGSSHAEPAQTASVAYSPPESFSHIEKADVRSDIYSMGIVLYELFTGKKPFYYTARAQIESWHRNETPLPANRINSSLSKKISDAINKALEKKQEDRFKDFLEFKNAMGLDGKTER